MPFRDDTSLVAFRYDQAAQAEPPIPIPPAKSPLRYQRAAAARARAATAGAAIVTAAATATVTAARPISCISTPVPAVPPTILARTPQSSAPVSGPTITASPTIITTTSTFPVIVAPPHPPPSGPLPLPPGTEEHLHPALRSGAPRSSDPDDLKNKRDSGHAPTTTSILTSTSSSSQARTFYDESSEEEEGEEDEDPFPYEKIQSARRSKFVPALLVPPLRIRSSSPTSLYAQTHNILGHGDDLDLGGTNNHSVSSIPLHSPGLSEANTVSPTSPTTPPPNFPEKTSASSSIFSRRSFSFRTSGSSSMKSSKRLKKKKQQHQQQQRRPLSESPAEARHGEPSTANPTLSLDGAKATTSSSTAPVTVVAPPRNGDEQSSRDHYHYTRLPNSPKLVTDASAHDGDDFADFVQQISFSKRGSIMLGGMRPSRHAANMSDDSGFAHRAAAAAAAAATTPASPSSPEQQRPQRVFPLASPPRIKANKNNAAHSNVADGDRKSGDTRPAPPSGRMTPPPPLPPPTPPSVPYADAPTTPKSARRAPSIRLISVEVERESQKVRSLYEPREGLRWEDGAPASSHGERLEPTVEVPSDVDENSSKPSPSTNTNSNPDDQPGVPQPATGIPESAGPSASRPDEQVHHTYERVDRIEDWEDVEFENVDRFGFIVPKRPMTPSSAPATIMDSPSQSTPRSKHRSILGRRGAASHSQYLGAKQGPGRRASARSLHTQTSGLSTGSKRSTRSALGQAANLLPHNKDRKCMDEAGEMLAQEPGFSGIGEDLVAGQLADEYRRKEWQRTEKWRKMAKIVKPGKEGEGMVFEFDTKHPKIVERTWKGIPDRWRASAWYSFLATSARNSKKPCATDEELSAAFFELQGQSSPDDVQIDLDVPRTISQHIMFRKRYRGGQRLLFRVLHALSLYFPLTGYVQGMASLAATLLSYYDEERCFIMLVRLWELRGLNRLYSPNFTELMEALQDFEKYWLAEKKNVAKSLKELCIDPTAYGTRWYLTLFHLSMPFSAQLRIWDVFMLLGASPPDPPAPEAPNTKQAMQISSKGLETIHATSTAIILALSEHIVDSEFENAMKALTSFVPVKNDDLLMKVVHTEYKQYMNKMKKF
ncbi:hypothetical protein PFICI_11384 [Pestalotiopsis fici W106-1]|uniref:Rab-GAP TBC domain-containing protein n=1 Tax=Pestalotiopsis fici (strain W106-1 / CGMCC3.15140) TaxID=1229662 RepID=W3WUI6_PESFW|nr:uncharacterized protein PFICI_11384 [Pestalotiopsis fici W106-1]ETS77510.1 hypothetical protein PFICI_11384 [Pestalotiopsis fici W106-1]